MFSALSSSYCPMPASLEWSLCGLLSSSLSARAPKSAHVILLVSFFQDINFQEPSQLPVVSSLSLATSSVSSSLTKNCHCSLTTPCTCQRLCSAFPDQGHRSLSSCLCICCLPVSSLQSLPPLGPTYTQYWPSMLYLSAANRTLPWIIDFSRTCILSLQRDFKFLYVRLAYVTPLVFSIASKAKVST